MDWLRRKPLKTWLSGQVCPDRSKVFFWTGRGPFSFLKRKWGAEPTPAARGAAFAWQQKYLVPRGGGTPSPLRQGLPMSRKKWGAVPSFARRQKPAAPGAGKPYCPGGISLV